MRVFVLTSNSYLHVIPGFCHLFNKFWSPMQAVILVGYDQRPPNLPRNFAWWSMGKQEQYTWSSGVMKLCEMIPDQHFILMLEDYYLDKPVPLPTIGALEVYMQRHPEVAKLDLTDDRLKLDYSRHEDSDATQLGLSLIKSEENTHYQFSVQAAIWRRDFLMRYLDRDENAWQAEKNGTKRIVQARRKGEETGLILGCQRPPVTYVNAIGGEGSHPQEWALKRFPAWMLSDLRAHQMM